MRGQEDTYSKVRTFTYPNAIVRVHFPDLTEEENERRYKEFLKATDEFLKALIRLEKGKTV